MQEILLYSDIAFIYHTCLGRLPGGDFCPDFKLKGKKEGNIRNLPFKAQPMPTERKPIAIFGGTGHYGREVTRHLVRQGTPVRVLSQNAAKARELLGPAVEIVEGDVTARKTIRRMLAGSSGVVVSLSAANPRQIRQMKQIERDAILMILEEMEKAGLRKLAYLSVYDIREELLERLRIRKLAEIKIEVEQRIKESGLDWTILGCPPSYELFFALLRGDKLIVPGGGRRAIACISPEDVGAIAAQVAVSSRWNGRRIRLCGPEAVNFPEMARRISEHSGRKVRVLAVPLQLANVVSFLAQPFFPFLRFIYYSLKMMNNFPEDLAAKVPEDHAWLREQFDYEPVSLEEEIGRRRRRRGEEEKKRCYPIGLDYPR